MFWFLEHIAVKDGIFIQYYNSIASIDVTIRTYFVSS